jgi:hypothetical protein
MNAVMAYLVVRAIAIRELLEPRTGPSAAGSVPSAARGRSSTSA